MPAIHGYRVAVRKARPKRPAGVGLLAALGVLGSATTLMIALIQVINLMRVGAQPNRQFTILIAALVFAFIALWINWGFWELIRWAWWANLGLTILSIVVFGAATRSAPAIGEFAGVFARGVAPAQLTTYVFVGLIALIAYHLIAAVYMFAVRAVFMIGVKEEKPLWEQVRHRSR